MFWENSAEIILLLGAVAGCCGSIILLICTQSRMSRCNDIKLCWGCIKCDRENLSEEQYQATLDASGSKHPPSSQVGSEEQSVVL